MLYKELKDIPLWKFIEIYKGNTKHVVSSGEHDASVVDEAAKGLIDKYFEVTGRVTVSGELALYNDRLNGKTMVECASACRVLISMRQFGDVCEILQEFGYSLHPGDIPGIALKVEEVASVGKRKIEHANGNIGKPFETPPPAEYLKQEVAIVADHFKAKRIDGIWNTQRFAESVKRTCEHLANNYSK